MLKRKIKFNRENDALTKPSGILNTRTCTRHGAHSVENRVPNDDPYGYRSRKRKMDRDADVVARLASEMDVMKKTVSALVAERDASHADEDHPMDLSQQREKQRG
ncbi:hypothetical protein QYE76_056312 [Lolium multiflorum]|uniref:Uncharacterized protein n=1 Tax=Lolium multiflorum TaxID=4521 RepID=A0AAD8WPQ8_LOLMU|nr:hypothetical protein QYE76_056312 [Lolium multiflorum]